jgi:hypothetical protein
VAFVFVIRVETTRRKTDFQNGHPSSWQRPCRRHLRLSNAISGIITALGAASLFFLNGSFQLCGSESRNDRGALVMTSRLATSSPWLLRGNTSSSRPTQTYFDTVSARRTHLTTAQRPEFSHSIGMTSAQLSLYERFASFRRDRKHNVRLLGTPQSHCLH